MLGGKEGESLDDKHRGKGRVCEGSARRERKGGQQACYRLLLLTADLSLSGDVDFLSLCVCLSVCLSVFLSVCVAAGRFWVEARVGDGGRDEGLLEDDAESTAQSIGS